MCDAALQGVGLAWMSECAVAEGVTADRLITVLDDWSGRTAGLCLYYPGTGTCRRTCARSSTSSTNSRQQITILLMKALHGENLQDDELWRVSATFARSPV
jgi:hypothetical protein